MDDRKYFLSKIIHVCSNCGKVDVSTFVKFSNGKAKGIYEHCKNCDYIRKLTIKESYNKIK